MKVCSTYGNHGARVRGTRAGGGGGGVSRIKKLPEKFGIFTVINSLDFTVVNGTVLPAS